jgi:macrolide transport system ATP-binding/permease protein
LNTAREAGMAMFLSNVRSAWRQLTRSPGVSLVAVLSLALGIGANTTVFTLVNALLLHPMPVRDVSRVVVIGTTEVRDGAPQFLGGTSRPNFLDLRDRQTVFSGAVLTGFTPLSLSGSGDPEQLFAQIVSGNYFDVLGPPLAAGRTFIPDEDRELGAHPVIVLSHAFWMRRFGGDPSIVGRALTLNGQSFTVIGVTAEGFRGTFPVGGPDLWVPFAMYREVLTGLGAEGFNSRRGLIYQAFARLKEGVSLEQAQANVDSIGRGLAEAFPTDNRGRSFALRTLTEAAFPPAFKQQLVLSGSVGMAVVALVLLIACGNVANLLLARASTRRQEIAVRLAIGASRRRLIQQFLAESLLLAVAGGVGGLFVAYWSRALIWAYRPPFLQAGAIDLNFDVRVLAFSLAVSLITGLLFGLAPALQGSSPNLVTELKERTTLTSGTRWYNVRHLLVVGQVALSVITLVAAGLFLRSLSNAQRIDLGFDGDRLVALSINAGTQGFNEARGRDLYRRILERLAGAPGVESVTLSSAVPLFGGGFSRTTFRDDQDIKDPRSGRLTQVNEVGDRYFETLGIPIVRGRAFTANDRQGSTPVIIINEAMAKQFFPNEEPIGRHLHIFNRPPAREIVGIAKTIKYNSVGEEPTSHMYLPIEQNYSSQVTVQVRAAGEPEAVLGTVRRELQQLEPTMPLLNVNTYRSILATSLWAPRMGASLLTIFGVLALLLAAVGLYGVMAYSVTQRTREIGIRMALGAQAMQVRRMVVQQGVLLAVGGMVLGVAGAFALSRLVTRLLFGISGADPFTFIVVPAVLLAVAGIATTFPAWKASRVDPIDALRV